MDYAICGFLGKSGEAALPWDRFFRTERLHEATKGIE